MKFKQTFIKISAAFLFGIAAISFSVSGIDSAATHSEIQKNPLSCFPHQSAPAPSEIFHLTETIRPTSELMARLFQLMFILFFISPPIIALMLFLIWKELKKRNNLK